MPAQIKDHILFGKILGELYRVQRHLGIPSATDATIYALLNGFESAIDDEIQGVGHITRDQERHVVKVLNAIWKDEHKLSSFMGFYDIEGELQCGGVDRVTAIAVLKFLKARGQFVELISKMDTSHSPEECRTFDLDQFDI